MLYWNPQECRECGITYCELCLKISLEKEEICPLCKKGAKFEPCRWLLSRLDALKFKCINLQCSDIIGYKELLNHICPYDILYCQNEGCTWKGERTKFPNHAQECPCEVIHCPNKCEEMIKRGDIYKHRGVCLLEEVECPNKCEFSCIREDMGKHVADICPLERLTCYYAERGCKLNPIRTKHAEHIQKCPYQATIMKCKHEVNQKDRKEHKKNCPDYLFKCEGCSVLLVRKDLPKHI